MYQLTKDDLWDDPDQSTPFIRAAAKQDPALLEALLVHHAALSAKNDMSPRERRHLRYLGPSGVLPTPANLTPIIAATNARLPHNVRLLLAAGADPNGIELDHIGDTSVRFIRGRDIKDDINSTSPGASRVSRLIIARQKGISHQICPLTQKELDERASGFPRFWTEPNVPGQRLRSSFNKALTALEIAAKTGSLEIVDMLRAAGADESAWVREVSLDEKQFQIIDVDWSVSFLSTSSPVHEAIAAGQQPMLRHLLSTCGYSPNYRPYAAPTVALPPLSYAIARCDLNDSGVQRCLVDLLSHPQLDANLRTPIFEVHPLHFATAHHNPELLSWLAALIPGGYGSAGTTALGHTLLHIAALPSTAHQIMTRNPDVARSIHCARTLDSKWWYHRLPSPLHADFSYPEEVGCKNTPIPMTVAQQQAQQATIRALLEWGGLDVRAKDVDGNTALHYLAGTLNVSDITLAMVRARMVAKKYGKN
jgi:ankyrin repeat protein